MEGPSGQQRPRTAGGRAGSPQGEGGVRDWQRNTWYGPAPVNSNPFDEPEDAPELKETRSANVNLHMGEFWTPQQETGRRIQTAAAGNMKQPAARGNVKQPDARGNRGLLLLLSGVLVLLIATVLILRFAVFTVREIQVTGNEEINAEEIIRISGIRTGDSILSLNEDTVEQRITSDYRLLFRYMARQMPNKVVIAVKEREKCCWLIYGGIIYVMDKNRMILEESEDLEYEPEGLVKINGLGVRSGTGVGQYLTLNRESQQTIISELFLEMKVQNCTSRIAEAEISDTDSILLTTRDGYTVRLGSHEKLHGKIRSMLLVWAKLNEMGYTGGAIDVTNPETPIFTP